jgi:hypothetical protein
MHLARWSSVLWGRGASVSWDWIEPELTVLSLQYYYDGHLIPIAIHVCLKELYIG